MEYLGIDRRAGSVYEGELMNGYRVLPPPMLVPIRFSHGKELPILMPWAEGLAPEIFREDDFDAVTKIRRGRVFRMRHCGQPSSWIVYDPHLQSLPTTQGVAPAVRLMTYERHILPDLTKPAISQLPTVALGGEPHVTFWRIVSLECNLVGTPVLTLRARHSLGDTPEILEDTVPPSVATPLREAIESVEASVNRLSPVEVIDRCRGALSIAFGYQAGDMGKDLSRAIDGYLKKQDSPRDNLCSWCGRIVARLHARGKPNEQAGKGLRPPTESDADLALDCLKTVLIDFGWAR